MRKARSYHQITLLLGILILCQCNEAWSTNNFVRSDSIKLKKAIHLGYTGHGSFENTGFTIAFAIRNPKHTFLIGPSIRLGSTGPQLSGGALTYQFYPNGINRTFSFYFLDDLSYSTLGYSEERTTWINGIEYESTYESSKAYLANYFGYGFDLKIVKGLYLDQSLALGIAFKRRNYSLTVPELPSNSYSYDEKLLSRGEVAVALKIGLTYWIK